MVMEKETSGEGFGVSNGGFLSMFSWLSATVILKHHIFEIGNDEVHHRNLPRNLENPSHEVEHEDVQLVQVPFLR
nr:hypothetical protein Iba_chr05fCG1210 [Ipomoea batatas]GMD00794.1 hypothetical protein Iba_chr05fCG1250 [Ipomoea batatas]